MLKRVLKKLGLRIERVNFCRQCHRPLYCESSQQRGYGSICWHKKQEREEGERLQMKLFEAPKK